MPTGSLPMRYSSTRASVTPSGADTVAVELENATVADRVNRTGAARVTAQPGARQAEAGSQIFRGRPDDLLVEDDGLPLLVRAHRGQHARKLPRAVSRRN